MASRAGAGGRQFTILQIIGAAFAALMGLVAVFDAVRGALGAGNVTADWSDAGLSIVTALLALWCLWLAGRGREQLGAWLLVVVAALRVTVAAGVIEPHAFSLLWPLYLLPIVMAQVLISGRAGFLTSFGAIVMFVLTYAGLSDSPELTASLPEIACANALLYVIIGSLVYVATMRMTTALKQSDKLLSSHERARVEAREREEQFHALSENSATGIVIHQDGHLVYGNPQFFNMAKCRGTDCFGLALWDFFDTQATEEIQAQLSRRKAFGTDPVPPNQVRFQPLNGPARWCEVAVAEAVFWQKPAIIANLLDVTDRVEAQQAVARERDFSNNIINTADAIIMVLNGEGRIVLLNPAGERLSGYSQDEMRGKLFWDVLAPPELRQKRAELFESIRARTATGEVEVPWQTRDGEEITIAWRYVGQFDKQDQLTGVVAVGIDVTQQRILERQAIVTERLRSLGQIAGGVAHDLNNMLAGIMGPTDLLMLVETQPEKERSLKGIMAAATRGAETVRRIQSFSKARTDIDKQVFDLRELTEDVIFSLRPRWKDAAQRQGLTIKVHDEVPSGLLVHASAGEIGNVIMNLIVNACEAMTADGEITVTGMPKDDQIQFHVSDTGSGMSPETVEQIFKPFFSTKGADNSGLGLAVIHGIILRHGGSIAVDSTPGKGTTFTIRLPAQVPDTIATPATSAAEASDSSAMRILVVDDVPEIADYLVAISQRAGHEATATYSGETALECLQQASFDVLITDYGMEGISGPDLAQRAHVMHPGMQMVLVTGWDVQVEEFPLFCGMLKKPCTREQVQDMLEGLRQGKLTGAA